MLDIFRQDAFSVIQLTDSINRLPYKPGLLSQRGLFTETGITSLSVVLDERNGVIGLVPPTPRGGPGVTIDKQLGNLRSLVVPHFQIDDAIMADEVQGIRQFGSETALQSVQGVVNDRLAEHAARHDLTLEAARVGAVIGVVTYADGSTIDLFNEFGVSQDAEIDFDLDNASPASGALRRKCAQVRRAMGDNLQMGSVDFGINAITGDAFFDDLIAHTEVRATYLQTAEARDLREGYAYEAFTFGGITFENYRGASLVGLNTDKAHFYPVGIPGLFKSYFAPADYVETVNTRGLPRYAKQFEMPNGKGINFETQTNNLNLCLRPKALIKGKRT